MTRTILSATTLILAATLTCPAFAQGRGGRGDAPQLTPAQQAAVRALNETGMPLTQASNEARNALNAAIFTNMPDAGDIRAKNDKLAAAELARATALSEAFGKLQASPEKLDLPQPQILMIMGVPGGGRGGRGGAGGGGGGGRGGADRGPGLEAQEQPARGGRGGGGFPGGPQLSEAQQAAVRAINETGMPLEQAASEARNALNAAIFTNTPDAADIRAKNEKLAAAELARATALSGAFAKLQASPDKLDLPQQQIMMLLGGRGGGGRGGFGGRGGGRGGQP